MSARPRVRAVVFDAFATLFDVHSVRGIAESLFPGRGEGLSQLWRAKQLEYTWLRTMSDRYIDFMRVTEDALEHAARRLDLELDVAQRAQLLAQYLRLDAFPEVAAVVAELKHQHVPLAILSNGTPAMLEALVRHALLDGMFDHLLSVDSIKVYKTDSRAYRLGAHVFNASPQEVAFVSSNGWDVCAATWYGFRTFWVNRQGLPPEELGVAPEASGSDLRQLVPVLDAWR